MVRRVREINIDRKDPWANDDLNRKPSGEVLRDFIKNLDGPFVIALTAGWGSGKTTFLRRMEAELENHRVPVIRLDVWRNDHLGDPLPAFISSVLDRLRAGESGAKMTTDLVVRTLAKEGAKLCGSVLGGLANVLLPGASEAIKAGAEAVTSIGTELLDQQAEHEKSVAGFRKQLENARDQLTGRMQEQPIAPVVFMIDELDRCRPHFCITVLERIKHFFDIDGIIFVLATDSANLPSAVKAVYGSDIDADIYLRKFVEYEFRLPELSSQQFVRFLIAEMRLERVFMGDTSLDELLKVRKSGQFVTIVERNKRASDVVDVFLAFTFLTNELHLTLRDQTQAMTMISAVLRAAPVNVDVLPMLLTFMVMLRFKEAKTYAGLRNRSQNIQDLSNAQKYPFLRKTDTVVVQSIIHSVTALTHPDRDARIQYLYNRYNGLATENKLTQPLIEELPVLSNRVTLLPKGSGDVVISIILEIAEAFSPEELPPERGPS
jgi:hypothetical protein